MPNSTFGQAVATLAVFLVPAGAEATGFSVIARVPGGPQIGALRNDVIFGTADSTLFSLSSAGAVTMLHSFVSSTDGSTLNARLGMDSQGDVFGTAQGGGKYGAGTLWEYSASGAFSVLHALGNAGDGAVPLQGPTVGPGNVIYDTTAMGDANTNGIIFKMTHGGTYAQVYNFLSDADGHCPFSGVAVSGAGVIYGTTVGRGYGGNPDGSVWQYSAKAGLLTLYKFQDANDGEWPTQSPTLDFAGNLHGTTAVQSGSAFAGAVWKISASGVFSVLRNFDGATDGYGPNSPLLLDADGNLYGTTGSGGANNFGTLFRISTTGAFAVMHSFANGSDGAYPTGNLVQNAGGAIFGGTASGVVFRYVP